jgi:hypothetical protein
MIVLPPIGGSYRLRRGKCWPSPPCCPHAVASFQHNLERTWRLPAMRAERPSGRRDGAVKRRPQVVLLGYSPRYYSMNPNRFPRRVPVPGGFDIQPGMVRTAGLSLTCRRMIDRRLSDHRLVPDKIALTIKSRGMWKTPASGLEGSRIGKKAFTPSLSRTLRWNPTCIARRGATLSNGATDADGR